MLLKKWNEKILLIISRNQRWWCKYEYRWTKKCGEVPKRKPTLDTSNKLFQPLYFVWFEKYFHKYFIWRNKFNATQVYNSYQKHPKGFSELGELSQAYNQTDYLNPVKIGQKNTLDRPKTLNHGVFKKIFQSIYSKLETARSDDSQALKWAKICGLV